MSATLAEVNEPNRPESIPFASASLRLPAFFPSISTVKTNLAVCDYIDVLNAVEFPNFLVSAYDLYHCPSELLPETRVALEEARKRSACVLLDSGNYESYWKADRDWVPASHGKVLRNHSCTFTFSFDNQSPPAEVSATLSDIEASTMLTRNSTGASVLPIVHGNRDVLPELCRKVAQSLNPVMIAVAERELGEGSIERATTIRQIRSALDRSGGSYPLHLLGTGNPRAILLYVAAGANSFDGLEWCQTSVDYSTGLLHHFHQRDLFEEQPFACGGYTEDTLAHNLRFYRNWMNEIRANIDRLSLLIDRHFGESARAKIREAVGY